MKVGSQLSPSFNSSLLLCIKNYKSLNSVKSVRSIYDFQRMAPDDHR